MSSWYPLLKWLQYAEDVRNVAKSESLPLVDVFDAFERYGKIPGQAIDDILLMHRSGPLLIRVCPFCVPVRSILAPQKLTATRVLSHAYLTCCGARLAIVRYFGQSNERLSPRSST